MKTANSISEARIHSAAAKLLFARKKQRSGKNKRAISGSIKEYLYVHEDNK